MPHWRLFYHLVWATRDRYPYFVEPAAVEVVESVVAAQCRRMQVSIHELYVMPDHVHLACSIPPRWSISEVL